jgi:hypothetical protein
MIEIITESAGNIIGIRATGMLAAIYYDQVPVPKLVDLSHQFDGLRVLFYMDPDLRGWDLSAAWENTKLDFRFRGNLDKVAIVWAQHGRGGACGWQVL